MEIKEFATIYDVPVLKAGTHLSRNVGAVSISEAELDDIIEGSNELKELIKDSIETGAYKGNDINLGGRPIPGAINLFHQDILDETMKDRTKDVDWSFAKQEIDGEIWLTETFENVPNDVAKAIKKKFPFRSVELLPLTNPVSGKKYDNVIRSTAFLDRYTPPAVKGQSPDLHVEFSEGGSPVIVLYSTQPETIKTEVEEMAEQKKTAMPEAGKEEISLLTGKLSEKDKQIAELQAEKEARIKELEAEKAENAKHIAELQERQDKAEVREFMTALSNTRTNDSGLKFEVSKAFTEICEPLVSAFGRSDIVEFSGEAKPTRSVIEATLEKVVEMALNESILVPVTEMAASNHTEPGAKKDLRTKALEIQKTEGISYEQALRKAQGGN